MKLRTVFYKLRKFSTTIMAFAMVAVVVFGMTGCRIEIDPDETPSAQQEETTAGAAEHYIRFGYYDETYSDYLRDCISQYTKLHPEVHITLDLVSSENYLKKISEASSEGKQITDVYMIDNASLEIAYLAGLAEKNTNDKMKDGYCNAALNACSVDGNLVAYPLSYKTSFLAINRTYLTDEMLKHVASFEDIKSFSSYIYGENDSPEGEPVTRDEQIAAIDYSRVEKIFECNLLDIFLNYGFIGSGIDVGGMYADNPSQVQFNTPKAVQNAISYQELVDFFGIDASYGYDQVLKRFLNGQSICAILSTDSLFDLEKASYPEEIVTQESEQNDAEISPQTNFSFGAVAFPDYDRTQNTQPLAITTAVAVNPFSSSLGVAEDFAFFVSFEMANELYPDSGMLSARRSVRYEDKALADIYASYEKSVSKNKLQYGEQIYPRLEIALHNIVAGEDIEKQLSTIDEYMKAQLN